MATSGPNRNHKAVLKCTSINYKIILEENAVTVLGRDNALPPLASDKRVSRNQLEAVFTYENGVPCVLLTRVGVNPSVVVLNATASIMDTSKQIAEQNQTYILRDGDKFSMIAHSYYYTVKIKEKKAAGDISGWKNYSFYKNMISSRPDGALIAEIHSNWFDDVSLLEYHHGYIQWLFPLFLDSGMNSAAKKLNKAEAKAMRGDLEIARRFIMSYRLMLNFYGMKLVDEKTGEIARHDDERFCNERYQNLNMNFHNNLRISRIIISLGHLGFFRYKQPFIEFLTKEMEKNKKLQKCRNSLENHWKPLVYGVGTKQYLEKTLELPEDREESVFFKS